MPGARCARSLVCKVIKAHKHSHHGHTGNTQHSPRNGFNSLFRALPGDRALLPPSSTRFLTADLTPASGCQDHTASPSASSALVLSTIRVHRIPPRVGDVAQRPSCRAGTGRACRDDLPDGESGIFLQMGLDRPKVRGRTDLPVGQIFALPPPLVELQRIGQERELWVSVIPAQRLRRCRWRCEPCGALAPQGEPRRMSSGAVVLRDASRSLVIGRAFARPVGDAPQDDGDSSGHTAPRLQQLGDVGQHADRGLAGLRRPGVGGLHQRAHGRTGAGRIGHRHAKQNRHAGKTIQPKRDRPHRHRRSGHRRDAIGLGGPVDGGRGRPLACRRPERSRPSANCTAPKLTESAIRPKIPLEICDMTRHHTHRPMGDYDENAREPSRFKNRPSLNRV